MFLQCKVFTTSNFIDFNQNLLPAGGTNYQQKLNFNPAPENRKTNKFFCLKIVIEFSILLLNRVLIIILSQNGLTKTFFQTALSIFSKLLCLLFCRFSSKECFRACLGSCNLISFLKRLVRESSTSQAHLNWFYAFVLLKIITYLLSIKPSSGIYIFLIAALIFSAGYYSGRIFFYFELFFALPFCRFFDILREIFLTSPG